MFYSLLALSYKYGFKTSKHHQLIGWFNKEFIKTQKLDKKLSRIIQKAFESRMESDYDFYEIYEPESVLIRFEEMKIFITEIERLINMS